MDENTVRILVVDDELGMREGCRKILKSKGFSVETASNGLEALEVYEKCKDFSVALIDLKMPKMGGLELIERLHAMDEDLVLFVITAFAAIDTAVEATRRGAYAYIPKPFTPEELLMPIHNGLERRALTLEAKRLREERERRLLELAAERSQSGTIISCMTDGVVVINRDRQVVLCNLAAKNMIPAFAVLPAFSPLDGAACPPLAGLFAEALNKDAAPSIASQEFAVDKCTYMANVSPVLDARQEISGAVAVLRDITALKKLEIAKSTFISMVAHEVKAPLAAIESQLTLVLSGATQENPEHERSLMERALLRAKNLRNLVSDLLNLTAMETGNFTIKRSSVDVSAILLGVLDAYREKAEEKKIALEADLKGFDPGKPVLADPDCLSMIFNNLVDNALKYTQVGGRVEVLLSYAGPFVSIVVKDNGIGMKSSEAESVFEEFYRIRNAYTVNIPGTGLGLTLVKRLVELHNGTITLQSAEGSGSVFTVNIPISGQQWQSIADAM